MILLFYEKLQILCKKRGITLSSLVRDLGLSSGNLSKWKKGGRPRAATAQKIAGYLGVSLDSLFQDEVAPVPAEGAVPPPLKLTEIQYALYHETAGVSEDTLSRILEFARFAKAEEDKRKEAAVEPSTDPHKGTKN